jgi:hypothetical protein
MHAAAKTSLMTEISKEALDAEIESIERQLEALKALRDARYGPPEPPLPPVEHRRYKDLATIDAIKKYFDEQEIRQGEYETIYLALLAGSGVIRDTSNPPWAFKKSVTKSLKHGNFLLNGKSCEGQTEIKVGAGDIISLP